MLGLGTRATGAAATLEAGAALEAAADALVDAGADEAAALEAGAALDAAAEALAGAGADEAAALGAGAELEAGAAGLGDAAGAAAPPQPARANSKMTAPTCDMPSFIPISFGIANLDTGVLLRGRSTRPLRRADVCDLQTYVRLDDHQLPSHLFADFARAKRQYEQALF